MLVDGRTADVHRHAAFLAQFEGADRPRGRVMKAQHSEYGNRTVDTTVDDSPTRRHRPSSIGRRPPAVPDKPSLEGLEANGRPGGRRTGTYRFDRTDPGSGSSPSTRPRRPCRAPCTSGTSSPTPTPTPSPAFGACVATTSSTRWAGTTTVFPPNGGCRTTTECAATRPAATTPLHVSRRSRARTPVSISRPNFIELCDRLAVEDEKAFEDLWRTLGLSVDWSQNYATIDTGAPARRQHASWHAGAGHVYSAEAPTQWDVDFQTAVSQAELEDRELPGAYHRLRSPGPTARARSTSRPPARSCCPPVWRWSPIPTTTATAPWSATTCHPAVRGPGARPHPPARRSREGLGDRHDLHLRRHHRRHLVAGAGPADADHRWSKRPAASRSPGVRTAGRPTTRRGGPAYAESRAAPCSRPQTRIVEMLAERATRGEPQADPAPGQVLREAATAPRDRVQPAVVRADAGHGDRLLERGRELHWYPPYMLHRYEAWVEGLNGDWNISRQRFFGVPFPVWYPVGADG